MKENLCGAGDFTNRCNVVNHTNLIVYVHDADNRCVFTNRCGNTLWRNNPIGIGLQVSDLEAFPFQMTAAIQHSLVFNLGSNNVLAFALVELGNPLDRKIIRFGCSRCPYDLARITV